MKALILVDMQREFLPQGGWELPDSEAVVAIANRLQRRFRVVAAAQDWHLKSHKIFANNHDNRKVGDVVGFKRQVFQLTRVHCVQKTQGAELAPALQRDFIHRVFQRGMDSDLNGYSAFFENDHRTSTGLTEFLRARKVDTIYILGFSPDGCVLHTALDSKALGFKTVVIQDAVRTAPLLPAEKEEQAKLLQDSGVTLVLSRDLI